MKAVVIPVSPDNLSRALKFQLRSGMGAKRAAKRAECTPRQRLWPCTSKTCECRFRCHGNEASTCIPQNAFWEDLRETRTLAVGG